MSNLVLLNFCPGVQDYSSFFFALFYTASLADHNAMVSTSFALLLKIVFDLKNSPLSNTLHCVPLVMNSKGIVY